VEHEANYQQFLKFAGTLLTMDAADYLMKNRPEGFQVDMTTRQGLIEKLVEMLRDPTERRMTEHDLHVRTVQLTGKTLAELRAYRRQLLFKADHPTKESAQAYLKSVREERTSETSYRSGRDRSVRVLPEAGGHRRYSIGRRSGEPTENRRVLE